MSRNKQELRNFILENADILENTISANIGVGYPVIPGGSMKKFSGTRDGEYEGDADDKGSAEDDDDDKVAPSDVDEFDIDDTDDTENDERGDLARNESLRNFIAGSYLGEMKLPKGGTAKAREMIKAGLDKKGLKGVYTQASSDIRGAASDTKGLPKKMLDWSAKQLDRYANDPKLLKKGRNKTYAMLSKTK